MSSKIDYWSYLPTEKPYTKVASRSLYFEKISSKGIPPFIEKEKRLLFFQQSMQIRVATLHLSSCASVPMWNRCLPILDGSFKVLKSCLTKEVGNLLYVSHLIEEKTSKKKGPDSLKEFLELGKWIEIVKNTAPPLACLRKGLDGNEKDGPEIFSKWALSFFQSLTEFLQANLSKPEKLSSSILPKIIQASSHVFFEALIYLNQNKLNQETRIILQKNLIRQARIAVRIEARKEGFLTKFDAWSKKILDNPDSIEKAPSFTDQNFLFFYFFLEKVNYSKLHLKKKISIQELLSRLRKKTPLSEQEKKDLLQYYSLRFLQRIPMPEKFDNMSDLWPFQVPSFVFWSVYPHLKRTFSVKKLPQKFRAIEKLFSNEAFMQKLNIAAATSIERDEALTGIGVDILRIENKLSQKSLTEADLKGALKRQQAVSQKLQETSKELGAFIKSFYDLPSFVQKIKTLFLKGFFCNIPTVPLVLKTHFFPANSIYLLYQMLRHGEKDLFKEIEKKNQEAKAKIEEFSSENQEEKGKIEEFQKLYAFETCELQYISKIQKIANGAFLEFLSEKKLSEEKDVAALLRFWNRKENFSPIKKDEKTPTS